MDDIPLLPAIPERLRVAARQGTLVPFIGAGVSQLAGCPGWDEFANGALRFFVNRGLVTHGQFDQLSKLPARVKLSIAQGLERQHSLTIDFDGLLMPPNASAKSAGERVYAALSKLATTFVTTNYDDWLDVLPVPPPAVVPGSAPPSTTTPPPRRVLCRPDEFDGTALSTPNTVIHIHGSVRDREHMVFTTAHYLERYAGHRLDERDPRENAYLTFLQSLFRTRTVLFVGYSLGELEILEYVVQKARESGTPTRGGGQQVEPPHYLLQGFFVHEAQLKRSLEDYYLQQCGIGLLPFSRETQGWSQLVEVIEYLGREIPAGPVLGLQQRLDMEELLK